MLLVSVLQSYACETDKISFDHSKTAVSIQGLLTQMSWYTFRSYPHQTLYNFVF